MSPHPHLTAGTSGLPLGTRVKITGLAGVAGDDADLIGQSGEITNPFPGLMAPGVEYVAGVRLDDGRASVNLCAGDSFEVTP